MLLLLGFVNLVVFLTFVYHQHGGGLVSGSVVVQEDQALQPSATTPENGYDTPLAAFTTVHAGRVSSATNRSQDEEIQLGGPGGSGKVVAIGMGITTRRWKMKNDESAHAMWRGFEFFKNFLPSFCRTCSPGYNYEFFVAFDRDDRYLVQARYLDAFSEQFAAITEASCPPATSTYSLHVVRCAHSGRPAHAQNDAMWEAYLAGVDYYYRVNDDTTIATGGWTRAFINQLALYRPPNVGVVGPTVTGTRKKRILTYEFVHATHVEIFGFYYPRQFGDWFGDRWISDIYGSKRMTKLDAYSLKHTESMGRRYKVLSRKKDAVLSTIDLHKMMVARYVTLSNKARSARPPAESRVISMSLYGGSPLYTYGAIRNAQLIRIIFPTWRLRIYTSSSSSSRPELRVPAKILRKLATLGAEIVHVPDDDVHADVPPDRWRLLVALDTAVERFLVRDADTRLTERDAGAVAAWIATGAVFHCQRDHPSHAEFAINDGLWGAKSRQFREAAGQQITEILNSPTYNNVGHTQVNNQILSQIIWPEIMDVALCHDSVSSKRWPNSQKYAKYRHNKQVWVGRRYGPYGAEEEQLMISTDTSIFNYAPYAVGILFIIVLIVDFKSARRR